MHHILKYTHFLFALLLLTGSSALLASDINDPKPGNAANVIDAAGMRQGYWRITGNMVEDRAYKKSQVVEEGEYIDNKRNGVWKKYYPSGKLRSEITYKNNHPRGVYTTYFPDGTKEEYGDWQGNRNVGEYKRFHENGTIAQEFTFNEFGKREGIQLYYFPNGKVQMTAEIDNGTAHGMVKVYYSDGELRSEKMIVNGLVDTSTVKEYKARSRETRQDKEPSLPVQETVAPEQDRPNLVEFRDTGFNTLYNRNQQVTQVGEFKDGRLWNGKWHRYNSDGLLKKVEVYQNGRFAGYAVLDGTE
ncbi:MAG: toxin-antitoxin system YwqK family antitoxin [Cryomorphaceae bacterium]